MDGRRNDSGGRYEGMAAMGERDAVGMSLGAVLERSIAWGLPASPLFMAMLMALAYTPSALPAREADMLYLASMAGAVAGCAACIPRRVGTDGRSRLLYCCAAGIVLEAAWVVLTVGDWGGQVACTALGTFLVGSSTAVLLALWLKTDQTKSIGCELMKYAVALTSTFLLYSLLGIAPTAGWISFLFSPATCIPLAMRLGRESAATEQAPARKPTPSGQTPRPKRKPQHSIRQVRVLLPASALLVACGAGLSMLGYGGQQAEYGAGLTALVLVAALAVARRANPAALAGQLAAPLVVVALCYGSLFETGSPFALLLAGCGTFMAWALIALRGDSTPADRVPAGTARRLGTANLRDIALLLGWATVCAALGLAVAHAVAFGAGVDVRIQAITLVCIVVAVDLIWRTEAFGLPALRSVETDGASPLPGPDSDAALLERRCGLSPREADVAVLLCENRSVSYISTALELAPSTVKTHIRHIYEKTGAHSRSDLQLFAEGLREEG